MDADPREILLSMITKRHFETCFLWPSPRLLGALYLMSTRREPIEDQSSRLDFLVEVGLNPKWFHNATVLSRSSEIRAIMSSTSSTRYSTLFPQKAHTFPQFIRTKFSICVFLSQFYIRIKGDEDSRRQVVGLLLRIVFQCLRLPPSEHYEGKH